MSKNKKQPSERRGRIAQHVTVFIHDTDADLRRKMRLMETFRKDHPTEHVVMAISGYDFDPRPLWDIPEVATLCQRLVEIGFISCLDLCPMLDEAIERASLTPFPIMGWGAFETVLCAQGRLTSPISFDKELLVELMQVVLTANKASRNFLKEVA